MPVSNSGIFKTCFFIFLIVKWKICGQNAVKKGKKIPQTLVTSGLRESVIYSYSTVAGGFGV